MQKGAGRHRGAKAEGRASRKHRRYERGQGAPQNAAGSVVAKRRGSVLCAEFRGLTGVCSQLEPARLQSLLHDFFAAMGDVAVAHQAVIDRLVGDAFMLLYGVPRPYRDDPSRAVRTAVAMQQAFLGLHNRWVAEGCADANRLGLQIGVASGELVIVDCELVAFAGRSIVGEVVSRAARLCAAAEPGTVLVDQRTYEQSARPCRGAIDFTSTDLAVGSFEPLPAYRCAYHRSGLRLVPKQPYRDPVCGATVDPEGSVCRQVEGELHHFCSRTCAERFTEDPEQFAERLVRHANHRA
jgi:class 3 adenylate cyclase/YHS domain-containing protein